MPDPIERSSHRLRSADGTVVAVDRYRQGRRDTAVVICHGFFQSKATPTFQRLASALAQSYDVLCLDFRGHGGSSGVFTFSAREDAELQAVVHKKIQRVAPLGETDDPRAVLGGVKGLRHGAGPCHF